jgi:hypothetical protein
MRHFFSTTFYQLGLCACRRHFRDGLGGAGDQRHSPFVSSYLGFHLPVLSSRSIRNATLALSACVRRSNPPFSPIEPCGHRCGTCSDWTTKFSATARQNSRSLRSRIVTPARTTRHSRSRCIRSVPPTSERWLLRYSIAHRAARISGYILCPPSKITIREQRSPDAEKGAPHCAREWRAFPVPALDKTERSRHLAP